MLSDELHLRTEKKKGSESTGPETFGGSGLVNDSTLEARADREGPKASPRGEQLNGLRRRGRFAVERFRRIRGRADAGKKRTEEKEDR